MGSKDDLLSLFMNCKVTPPHLPSPTVSCLSGGIYETVVVIVCDINEVTLASLEDIIFEHLLSPHHHCLTVSSNRLTQDDDGVPFSAPKHRQHLRSVCASVVCGEKNVIKERRL